jgi:indole-3-glycerol phosphate synthase
MSILEQIVKEKQKEILPISSVEATEQLRRAGLQAPQPRGFAAALRNAETPVIIAEIKRASPSKGAIRAALDPVRTATQFAQNGAACLSVLTEEKFFGGNLEFIPAIRKALEQIAAPPVPILRKDFIIHPAQIWQTRAAGADAGLLIVAALNPRAFAELLQTFLDAALDVLVEVHTEEELETALKGLLVVCANYSGPANVMLGINNRDLNSFAVDLDTTKKLSRALSGRLAAKAVPPGVANLMIVSESGIFNAGDLFKLRSYGAQAFLIGESLVASGDPGENLARLVRDFRTSGSAAV